MKTLEILLALVPARLVPASFACILTLKIPGRGTPVFFRGFFRLPRIHFACTRSVVFPSTAFPSSLLASWVSRIVFV